MSTPSGIGGKFKMIKFGGGLREICSLESLSTDDVRKMPMLYRASIDFALQHAPQLRPFIEAVRAVAQQPYKYASLDVKVAMLKKDWWPCIPGWHLDDFYRPTGEQPDIANLAAHSSEHYMVLFGDCSLTQFIEPEYELHLPLPPEDSLVYGFYDRFIETEQPPRVTVQQNTLYRFTSLDFHRGMPATKDGWRAFVRLTLGNERPPKDEIRQQVQVYVPSDKLFSGW